LGLLGRPTDTSECLCKIFKSMSEDWIINE
jgi:hypothetical protein